MIKIVPHNETYVRVVGDDEGLLMDIREYFTFMVPGYRYAPKFKAGIWDGKIKLLGRSGLIYKGLIGELIKFFKSHDHEFIIDISLKNTTDLTMDHVITHVDSLDLHGRGNKLEVREYQYEAVYHALHNERSLLLSPTSSGKSLIIYSIIRWYIEQDLKILIVVPTTMLANQLFTDFEDYSSANGFDVEGNMSVLYSGKERVFDKHVVISTWQSLASMMKSDPKNFNIVVNRSEVGIWDECLDPSSMITLADGTNIPIVNCLPGMLVKTINESTGSVENKAIVKIHKNLNSHEKMYKIRLKNGKELKITGNHKIHTSTGWVRADEICLQTKVQVETSIP